MLKIVFWLKNNASLVFWILHTVGLAGFALYPSFFKLLTPFHLVTISVLLLWNGYEGKLKKLSLTFVLLWSIGMLVEIIGVNTGYLFGEYQYYDYLGWKLVGVPLVIGLNWMTLVLCAFALFSFKKLSVWITAFLSGVFITWFDYILEPIAIAMGWWEWFSYADGAVPFGNYLTWFVVVFLLTFYLSFKNLPKLPKKLALNFVLAQIVFFLLLQTL